MEPLLKASFNGTDTALLNKLRGALLQRILEGLRDQINIEDIALQSYIVREKLSGQVLAHRSGTLADSVRVLLASINGSIITGGVEAAGGDAFYGRFFEEGGKGPYEILPVNKKALAFFGSDGPVSRNASIVSDVTRGMASGTGSVRSRAISQFGGMGGIVVKRVIHPPIPKLPFMQPSLDENREGITTRVKESVIRSYNALMSSR